MISLTVDVQAIQSVDHPERGIARFVFELASSLWSRHSGSISALVHNPDLPIPIAARELAGAAVFRSSEDLRRGDADVHLITSPFEGVSFDRILPPPLRLGTTRVATLLYDLIPLRFPDQYLADPAARRRYLARLELIRAAAAVLCISEQTARDAHDLLGIGVSRIHVINGAPSARFSTPSRHGGALPRRVRPGHVFGVGGADWRKNLDLLVRAYAGLDPEVRIGHQLVIGGRLGPRADELFRLATDLGIGEDLVLTGVMSDDDLDALYRSAAVVVATSRFEGYGLPVVEARAAGAPVVAARASSFVELLPDHALVDPDDPADLSGRLTQVLTDDPYLDRLRASPLPPGHTWPEVAARTFEALDRPRRRGRRRRKKLAVVTPLPPAPTGIADYSSRLIEALHDRVDVEVFTPDLSLVRVPDGVGLHHLEHVSRASGAQGQFDAILHCWGNNEFHAPMLPVMRAWPGVVIAHDVNVAGLYGWCAEHRSELTGPSSLAQLARRMYPERATEIDDGLTWDRADRTGLSFARDVIGWSEQYLTHSADASARAIADAGDHADRVGEIDFAFPPGRPPRPRRGNTPLVAALGIVNEQKRPDLVVAAFSELRRTVPDAHLAFVGAIGTGMRRRLGRLIDDRGLTDSVTFTGRVPRETYERWLELSDVALALRASWGGEASGAIADALSWGLPTVASNFGWPQQLPPEVITVVDGLAPDELASAVSELLADDELRHLRAGAAFSHAREHGFDRLAEALVEKIG